MDDALNDIIPPISRNNYGGSETYKGKKNREKVFKEKDSRKAE